MTTIKLSNKELEIMQILWTADGAMSSVDIMKCKPTLKVSTVQSVIRTLLQKNYIEVADMVQHNTVYARTFKPCLAEKDYMMSKLRSSPQTFMSALVEQEESLDVLEQMEELIRKQKELLKQKDS